MARLALCLATATALATAFAAPARATFFTLESPVVIDASNDGGSGLRGRIRTVSSGAGTILASDGVVDLALQDVLLFDLRVRNNSTASVESVTASVVTLAAGTDILGVGAFDDAAIAPTAVTLDALNSQGVFDYGSPVIPGVFPSVRMFLTYPDSGPVGSLDVGQVVNFTLGLVGGGSVTVAGVVAPEPGTAALTALGLAALGAARRRR